MGARDRGTALLRMQAGAVEVRKIARILFCSILYIAFVRSVEAVSPDPGVSGRRPEVGGEHWERAAEGDRNVPPRPGPYNTNFLKPLSARWCRCIWCSWFAIVREASAILALGPRT